MIELNPNCSEATMRINVNDLNDEQIDELKEAIENIDIEKGEVRFNSTGNDSISIKDIFGIKVIEVDGDFPFNHVEPLENVIKEKEWKFKKKLPTQNEER